MEKMFCMNTSDARPLECGYRIVQSVARKRVQYNISFWSQGERPSTFDTVH